MVKRLLLGALLLGGTAATAAAQTYTATSKLMHVQEGLLPRQGTLSAFTTTSVYTRSNGFPTLDPTRGSGVQLWYIKNTNIVDYVVTSNLLVGLSYSAYQDVHRTSREANTPISDIGLTVKAASFPLFNDFVYAGLMGTLNKPLKTQNVWLAPYSAGSPELGLFGTVSYYRDNLFPKESFGLHANVGYYNHLDNGRNLGEKDRNAASALPTDAKGRQYRTAKVDGTTQAFRYGVGASYPTEYFDGFLEVWGNAFMSKPPVFAYTRENYAWATLGGVVRPVPYLMLNVSLDLLLAGRNDYTDYGVANAFGIDRKPTHDPDLSKTLNLPPYNINIGVQWTILPWLGDDRRIFDRRRIDINTQNGDDPLLELLRQEEGGDARTREELEELRRQRMNIEQNLDNLRKLLDQPGAPTDSTRQNNGTQPSGTTTPSSGSTTPSSTTTPASGTTTPAGRQQQTPLRPATTPADSTRSN